MLQTRTWSCNRLRLGEVVWKLQQSSFANQKWNHLLKKCKFFLLSCTHIKSKQLTISICLLFKYLKSLKYFYCFSCWQEILLDKFLFCFFNNFSFENLNKLLIKFINLINCYPETTCLFDLLWRKTELCNRTSCKVNNTVCFKQIDIIWHVNITETTKPNQIKLNWVDIELKIFPVYLNKEFKDTRILRKLICAPPVTRHTSSRYSSSPESRCTMSWVTVSSSVVIFNWSYF